MARIYLNDFEHLNTTTQSIYELGDFNVLIILKDGTNLTSWDYVENREDIEYISEDLFGQTLLEGKYCGVKALLCGGAVTWCSGEEAFFAEQLPMLAGVKDTGIQVIGGRRLYAERFGTELERGWSRAAQRQEIFKLHLLDVFLLVLSILSIIGATLLTRYTVEPLANLSRAAKALGRGDMPEELPDTGVAEICKMFNHAEVF